MEDIDLLSLSGLSDNNSRVARMLERTKEELEKEKARQEILRNILQVRAYLSTSFDHLIWSFTKIIYNIIERLGPYS